MLSENIYVNQGGLNINPITRWTFIWKCPDCGNEYIITKDDIEDFMISDPHDPLEDYFMCPNCNHAYGLFKGVEGTTNKVPSRIWADGTFIYLNFLGKDNRIV